MEILKYNYLSLNQLLNLYELSILIRVQQSNAFMISEKVLGPGSRKALGIGPCSLAVISLISLVNLF